MTPISVTNPAITPAPNPVMGTPAAAPPLAGSKAGGALSQNGSQYGSMASRSRNRLVLLSMGLVTAALAASLYTMFDVSLAASILAGGAAWCAFMALHVQVQKSSEVARLQAEIARLSSGNAIPGAMPQTDAGGRALTRDADPQRKPVPKKAPVNPIIKENGSLENVAIPAPAVTAPNTAPNTATGLGDTHSPISAPLAIEPFARWETPRAAARTATPAASAEVRASPVKPSSFNEAPAAAHDQLPHTSPVDAALWPGTSLSASDPMRDQWAFRPREPAAGSRTPIAGAGASAAFPPVTTIEADLEMVQRKIKAMADEVNAGAAVKPRPFSMEQAHLQAGPLASPQPNTLPLGLEKSIGALKQAAESMRERTGSAPSPLAAPPLAAPPLPMELAIPATAQRIAVSAPGRESARDFSAAAPDQHFELPVFDIPPAPPAVDPRIAAISQAIERSNMEVFLSPIVGLQTNGISQYEVTVRLKDPSGTYLDDPAQETSLLSGDLLALFDSARLTKASALAERLAERGKPGALLSAVSGQSMTHAGFLETFARLYEQRDAIAQQLVLTFTQADIEQFSRPAWQALSDMHAFGFRFALTGVDYLSIDFDALARSGFAFVKLKADAFLNGLPAQDRFILPGEICKRVAGAGLSLVVEAIDDEATRARIFGFGVLLGQGQLFGGLRAVKVKPSTGGAQSAAA